MEGIGVFEERAIEERSRSDLGEVQDVVADGDAGTRRRSTLRLEDAVGEVLYGEVRVRVNFNEGFQSHGQHTEERQ